MINKEDETVKVENNTTMTDNTIKLDSKFQKGREMVELQGNPETGGAANKRRLTSLSLGTGLAGASAAASLGELGFNVLNYCPGPPVAHTPLPPRRNQRCQNYQSDGDSFIALYDTIKGGDYRAREANVYRLAEVSNNIIDQCVAQSVPLPANMEDC